MPCMFVACLSVAGTATDRLLRAYSCRCDRRQPCRGFDAAGGENGDTAPSGGDPRAWREAERHLATLIPGSPEWHTLNARSRHFPRNTRGSSKRSSARTRSSLRSPMSPQPDRQIQQGESLSLASAADGVRGPRQPCHDGPSTRLRIVGRRPESPSLWQGMFGRLPSAPLNVLGHAPTLSAGASNSPSRDRLGTSRQHIGWIASGVR
jgi:hypothetical protein